MASKVFPTNVVCEICKKHGRRMNFETFHDSLKSKSENETISLLTAMQQLTGIEVSVYNSMKCLVLFQCRFFFSVTLIQIVATKIEQSLLCKECCQMIRLAHGVRKKIIDAFTNTKRTAIEVYKIVSTHGNGEELEFIQGDSIMVEQYEIEEQIGDDVLEVEKDEEEEEEENEVEEEVADAEELKEKKSFDPILLESITEDSAEDAVSFLLSKKELLKQNKSNGSEKRPHACQVCQKTFVRKSNLIDHLRLHANVRLYKCEYCEKSFVQPGNYRSHLRIHTKERPFKCSMCDKTYNQSNALKVHIRSHTNERNYVCEECGKAFTNSSDLGKHRRVHDPSKKMKCDHCDKSFAQKVNLKNHLQRHHSGNGKKKGKARNE